MVYKWVLNHLYPPYCVLCGAQGTRGLDVCALCFADLPWNRHPCPRCAAPLPPDADTPLCGVCLKSLPPWDEAKSPLAYAYPLDKLVQRFKFQGDLAIGRLLGELLADYLAAGDDRKPDLLIPVPLHPSRLKERGFNQAIELARPVAKRLRLKLAIDICERTRATEVQSKLDAAERHRNLRDAFSVRHSLQGKHVAIVDDVVTTGATATALATALKDAGTARVILWSPARAASPF